MPSLECCGPLRFCVDWFLLKLALLLFLFIHCSTKHCILTFSCYNFSGMLLRTLLLCRLSSHEVYQVFFISSFVQPNTVYGCLCFVFCFSQIWNFLVWLCKKLTIMRFLLCTYARKNRNAIGNWGFFPKNGNIDTVVSRALAA